MTKEKYFMMCEQLNKEPEPHEIPPDLYDFPIDVQKAIIVFNKLGDRIYPDIGYLGKDYVQLPIHIEVNEVQNKKIFLETLIRLDAKIIEKSATTLKSERDKIKRQSKAK